MTSSPHTHVRPHENLRARRQFVAGFVIFRRTHEGVKFLLLYRRGSYWNFPKGHFGIGETSFEAALREVEEETGLRRSELKITPDFRAYEKFYFQRGEERIHDTVILYLAETHKADVRISPREHSGFGWFLYGDAVRTVGRKYHGVKRILKQAHDFLEARSRRYQGVHS
jgi:dATP pyrophosphohydrolase